MSEQGTQTKHESTRQGQGGDMVMVQMVPAQPQYVVMNPAGPKMPMITSIGPQKFFCPYDQREFVSEVKIKKLAGAKCACIVLIVLCFPWSLIFLCCFPYKFQEAVHKCPQCHQTVGRVPYQKP